MALGPLLLSTRSHGLPPLLSLACISIAFWPSCTFDFPAPTPNQHVGTVSLLFPSKILTCCPFTRFPHVIAGFPSRSSGTSARIGGVTCRLAKPGAGACTRLCGRPHHRTRVRLGCMRITLGDLALPRETWAMWLTGHKGPFTSIPLAFFFFWLV